MNYLNNLSSNYVPFVEKDRRNGRAACRKEIKKPRRTLSIRECSSELFGSFYRHHGKGFPLFTPMRGSVPCKLYPSNAGAMGTARQVGTALSQMKLGGTASISGEVFASK